MKVLVLGGARFAGRAIVQSLSHEGHQVSVLTRGNIPVLAHAHVRHLRADRKDAGQLSRALSGAAFDLVIDNNAYTRSDIETLLRIKGFSFGHYFFTSTAWVYRLTATEGRTEDADLEDPGNEQRLDPETMTYIRQKRDCEKFILREMKTGSLILRPGIILGEDDHTMRSSFYLFRIHAGRPFVLLNGGKDRFTPLYVNDFGRAFAALASSVERKPVSGILNLASDVPLAPVDMIREWCKGLHRDDLAVDCDPAVIAQGLPGYLAAEPFCGQSGEVYPLTALRKIIDLRFTPAQEWLARIAADFDRNFKTMSARFDTQLAEREFSFLESVKGKHAIRCR